MARPHIVHEGPAIARAARARGTFIAAGTIVPLKQLEDVDEDLGVRTIKLEHITLTELGIIVPATVVRMALQNAVSVAGVLPPTHEHPTMEASWLAS